jgi:RNA polymerase sigma-70 factor, ECF subfamily
LEPTPATIDAVFRREHALIAATLIRAFGDWQLAEDALMDGLESALRTWPRDGIPKNPAAWLTAAARRRGIDRLRRQRTRTGYADAVAAHEQQRVDEQQEEDAMPDDRLSLIFTCCNPALATDAQVALTLRYVGGLTTREAARAFLVPEATMAKRLVRAKHKIRDAGIPYRVPDSAERPARLAAVCGVLYLVFNEGYAATSGDTLVRRELCESAIGLATMLRTLMRGEGEVAGLLALMLLTHSRRDTRTDPDGDLVLLEDQDRSRWDEALISRGHEILLGGLRQGPAGKYLLQAAIADAHACAKAWELTDWPGIERLYRDLAELTGSPVVYLNYAVAVAMARGPETGLALLDDPTLGEALRRYHLFWAARADLFRRLGRHGDAAMAYSQALELVTNPAERRFLEGRLASVSR